MTERISHQVVVIGGGNAGVSLAARLRRSGLTDIAIIEPADTHYYQPLWTLVGGGCVKASASARPEASATARRLLNSTPGSECRGDRRVGNAGRRA